MKRSLVSVVIGVGLIFSTTAFAKPPKEVPVKGKPADQAVLACPIEYMSSVNAKADGNLTEWHDIKGVDFSTLLSGEYEYDWTGKKDLSANLKVIYSENAFHLLVQVNDNAIVDKLRQWKSDRVEVWLLAEDGNHKPMGKLTGLQFDLGPVTKGGTVGVKALAGNKDLSKVKASAYVAEDKYDVEISVDYSLLAKVTPAYNGGMRYCVLVRDWDQDDVNEDEASIGNCPIDPKKPSAIKADKMAFAQFDLERIAWYSIVGADASIAAKSGDWLKKQANVAFDSAVENVAYLDNQFVIWGLNMSEEGGLAWTTMALNGHGEEPEITFADIDGDKLDEVILTRKEKCLEEGMTATRAYVFDHSQQYGLSLAFNYLVSVTNAEGKTYKNKFQNTKNGIVQTLSGGKPMTCTLDFSDDMEPLLVPGGEKKRTLKKYE
ncbi:MAG: hypothetical protein IIY06_05765 [Proteobacteria bacterium]|jgi:hypothetical protein|nr:hypothetical protein [Pseudomonadota bacterium]